MLLDTAHMSGFGCGDRRACSRVLGRERDMGSIMWPFRWKRRQDLPAEAEPVPPAPPGEGWRRWFELSARAAHDPPWNYEWVEMWRADWDHSRVTRSADIPYELNGPGFWWRPWSDPGHGRLVIEGDSALPRIVAPPPDDG
jgi:hypothetical protein